MKVGVEGEEGRVRAFVRACLRIRLCLYVRTYVFAFVVCLAIGLTDKIRPCYDHA